MENLESTHRHISTLCPGLVVGLWPEMNMKNCKVHSILCIFNISRHIEDMAFEFILKLIIKNHYSHCVNFTLKMLLHRFLFYIENEPLRRKQKCNEKLF